MTAPQEPLKLNPVEFANIAATITYEWTHEISTPELYSTMEFVAYVMKRTLALTARDDAAELRAAAEAWGDAHRHFRYVLAHPDQGSSEPYLWAEHEFYQAEERLRAALAATEGRDAP